MDISLDGLAVETREERLKFESIFLDGVFLPVDYERIADMVENFEVRDDDIWVCSFPRSGTTWTQEMAWGVAHDNDLESAKEPINSRFPFLEFSGVVAIARLAFRERLTDLPSWILNSVEYCNNLPSPRYIKSHLPFHKLPRQVRTGEKKPKLIYISRNPRDVCISFYHHSRLFEGYCGTFEQFCRLFLGDRVIYGPYWDHVLGFWDKRHESNIKLIKFENMKKDLPSVIKKIASFLEKDFGDEKVKVLAGRLGFAEMKRNPSVNRENTIKNLKSLGMYGDSEPEGEFIRNGTCGQWRGVMSIELIHEFDEWIKENLKDHKDYEL